MPSHPQLHPSINSLARRLLLFSMAEIQNSNPTILNAADLPTRLRPAATGKSATGTGIFTQSLSNASDFFSTSPLSSSEPESDDDLMEEPIDEQEIYGATPPTPPLECGLCFISQLTQI